MFPFKMTTAKYYFHKCMVLQYSKLFYSEVSSGLLRQDLQNSHSFDKTSVLLEKDFIVPSPIYFSTSFAFYFVVSDS